MEKVKVFEDSKVIVLNGEINDETAAEVVMGLLSLEDSPVVTLMINSPGGNVQAGWTIIDTIELVGNVETICIGHACSMAAMVLMSGETRSILPHARVMLHQPMTGAEVMQASDFEIVAEELKRCKNELYRYICERTGRSHAQVTEDCDRNHWFDAQEALDYGIVDKIVYPDNRDDDPVYPAGNI